ncbi:35967_t:CDS:2, partial [Gigaspora margarita]
MQLEQAVEGGRKRVVLWDLPKSFGSIQVKRMVGRYGKVISIKWIYRKTYKAAECELEVNNERSERLLQEAWVLPYGTKLTRVTVGKEHQKILEERKRYRAIISGFHKNTAEVLLLRHMRQFKAKSVYIPPNNEQLKKKEIQEFEKSSRKFYDESLAHYKKNQESSYERNNKVQQKKNKQSAWDVRGNGRRNGKKDGYRMQKHVRENKVLGNIQQCIESAKGESIEKDQLGPLENGEENKAIKSILNTSHKKERITVIVGDFNWEEENECLEKGKWKSNNRGASEIIQYIKEKNFVYAYREVNPDRFESTWEGRGSESRIDYIWYKKSANVGAYRCDVVDMDNTTGSDHRMIIAYMATEIGNFRTSRTKNKRLKNKRFTLDIKNINAENWEQYGRLLEKKLKKKWEDISANESTEQEELDRKIRGLRKEARIISKLCRKCKRENSQGISKEDNKKIQTILEKFGNEEHSDVLAVWNERWEEHILKNNLNMQVLKVAKQYQLGFEGKELGRDLEIMGGKLINREGNRLLTWGQIRQLRGKKGTGRKPVWFKELELKMISDTVRRDIKEEFKTKEINHFAITPVLQEDGSSVDIEHWCKKGSWSGNKTVVAKCEGCEIRQEQEESSCIVAARFKNKKRALAKNIVHKESGQF